MIFLYVFFYPPFRPVDIPLFIPLRLTIETLVLMYLLTKNQLVNSGKIQVNLLWAVLLMLLFGMISPEPIRNVLSFFNKLLFLILLGKVFQVDYKLMVSLRRVWIYIWFFISFSAIIAIIGDLTGLVPFYYYNFGDDTYSYYFFPLIGSITYRGFFNYSFPQYVGWMYEHGMLSYYFSLNVILSNIIYKKSNKFNWFGLVNFIGGLLTFSITYYLFFFFYFIFTILKKIKIKWLFYFIIPLIINYAIYFYQNPEMMIYTSLSDRVWRVDEAVNMLLNMNTKEIIFGVGKTQTHSGIPGIVAMHGGQTVGITGMLLRRGLLLTVFCYFLMFKYTNYNKTLLTFIFYYSFAFSNIFFNPVSLLILVLGYWSYNYEHIFQKYQLSK